MEAASVRPAAWRVPAKGRVPILSAVALAGVAATALTARAVARSPILLHPTELAVLDSVTVATWVGAGSYVWWKRPDSRLGPLMAAFGFLCGGYSLAASGNDVLFTLGMVVSAAIIVALAYVVLCFPSGRLESGLERWFMAAFALSVALLWALILALAPTLPAGGSEIECGTNCPHNPFALVGGAAEPGKALGTTLNIVVTIGLIGVAMLMFSKARSPSPLRRRTVTPLAVAAIALIVEFVTALYLLDAYPEARQPLLFANYGITFAAAIAILIGLARGRSFAARSVGRIAMSGSEPPRAPAAVQGALREALGDPSLTLALWTPQRAGYLDVRGSPIDLPRARDEHRAITPVTRDGSPVAALIYDSALDTDAEIVGGLAATSLMLLENTRLVGELRDSQARTAESAQRERLRMERDLHDGAQQRLMAIQVKLRLAEQHVSDVELSRRIEEIRAEAAEAVDELRALAHGIYPSALRDGGLADGLCSLAMRASIPVSMSDEGIGRCPGAVEANVYFCALEAVQNASKHAGPGARVTITLGRNPGGIRFEIADDGVGMDASAAGNCLGLVSMRDRIGAVGGELEISASPGRGTIVRGTVPDRSEVSSEVLAAGGLDRRFVKRGDSPPQAADTVTLSSGRQPAAGDTAEPMIANRGTR
jgi:signal transduction histidine kinase